MVVYNRRLIDARYDIREAYVDRIGLSMVKGR